ncbi:MAG: DUF4136 domain-containing protein, partial [Cyclobacteriaceae bacterium]|nr:DUF4136 domain-containing protein [Cyclobacteriaceae bacterium]
VVKHFLFITFFALVFSGCSVSIKETYDKQVDFSQYKTFCWMAGCEFKFNGPEYLQDSLLQDRIKSAIVDELTRKGLTLNTDNPDLLVGFTITVKDEQAIVYHRAEDSPFFIKPLALDREVINYLKGSLIIGMADAKESRMVWQSHVSAYMELEPDLSEANIRKGIKQALKNYPPKTDQH